MTPKEKAKELFDKYQDAGSKWYIETTKKYALIAVDEIMKHDNEFMQTARQFDWWLKVKQEIKKL